MKRKESIGRLLLSLVTVFIMVAGAFVVAVYTDSEVEQPDATIVASEMDEETREIGEAPISALDTFAEAEATTIDTATNEEGSPMVIPIQAEPERTSIVEEKVPSSFTQAESMASSPGTRNPDPVLDANGPYGTESSPLYEGTPVNFQSTLTDGGSDISGSYKFRWEVTGDGEYDGPGAAPDYWGDFGETDYFHNYCDNFIGEATVEAWDTVSYVTDSGTYWNNDYPPYWYMGGYYYITVGMEFTLHKDVVVDQLGACRYYYPYQYYNIRLWTSAGVLLREVPNPSIPYYSWRWFNIPSIPLSAGDYVISVGVRGYYQCGHDNPGISADGVMEPTGWCRYTNSYTAFPSQFMSESPIPYIDIHYTYSIPDVISDTADVFVDNVAPIVINPEANPPAGKEGTEVEFTASFYDPGTCDDWEYRWYFCDGTYTPWRQVDKWIGGARILFCTTWSYDIDTYILPGFTLAIGNFATAIDQYDWGPVDHNAPPDLDYMLQYDVVIVGTNYIPSAGLAADMGDRLAEYAMAGGNVVQMWSSFHTSARITGMWTDEDFNAIERGSLYYGYENLGAFDPFHPIMKGVSSFSAYYHHYSYSENIYADWVADYTSGRTLAAASDVEGSGNSYHPLAPNSRIVGLAYWPNNAYCTGDAYLMLANAVKWASQQPDPTPQQMPIALDPIYHVFEDDYPTHKTPCDEFCARCEVKDDDHGKAFPTGDKEQLMTQDFSSGVPPIGWTRSGRWANNWVQSWSTNAGGTSPEAGFLYYLGYGSVDYGRLHSGPIDTTGWTTVDISFREYLSHYSGGYRLMVETSTDGVNWVPVYQNINPTGFSARITTIAATANIGSPTTYFSITFYGDPWNLNWWYVDDVLVEAYPSYIMEGLGSAETSVIICNCIPEIINIPEGFEVKENKDVTLEGLEIYDQALYSPTEEFWYRYVWGDGTQTPWIYKGSMVPPPLKLLVYHSLGGGEVSLINSLQSDLPVGTIIDSWDFYSGAQGVAPVSVLDDYDVVFVGINLAPFDGHGVGDSLAAYADLGGNVVESVASFHETPGWWGVWGRWRDEDYTTLREGGIGSSSSVSDIYDPTHPIVAGPYGTVNTWQCGIPVASPGETPGATLLADFPNYPAAAYYDEFDPDNPSLGNSRIVGLNNFYYPGYFDANAYTVLLNAIWWASGIVMPTPVLDPVTHLYGDNGVYIVDVQVIDDDMNWHWIWGSGNVQPEFNLDPDEMDDWISHNYVKVEVQNCDPHIKSKRAYVPVEMTIDGGTMTVKQYHRVCYESGTTDILYTGAGPFAFEFDVTSETSYSVDVTGGTFTLSYPTEQDIKSRSETFTGPATLTNDDLLVMLFWYKTLVTCEAKAYDQGSDDLAFIWAWPADGGEHANDGSGKGRSIYIFDSHGTWTYDSTIINIFSHKLDTDEICNPEGPDHGLLLADVPCQRPDELPFAEPDYFYPTNEIKTPEVDPIDVMDRVVFCCAFHPQWGFYEGWHFWQYVTITVVDDDVDDCLPQHQPWNVDNHPGCDMDFLAMDYPDYGHPDNP